MSEHRSDLALAFGMALLVSAVRHFVAARLFVAVASVSPRFSAISSFNIVEHPISWTVAITLVGVLGDVAFCRLYASMVTTWSDMIKPIAGGALFLWSAYMSSGIVYAAYDLLLIFAAIAGWFDIFEWLMNADTLRWTDGGLYFMSTEVMTRLPLIAAQGAVATAIMVRWLRATSWDTCLVMAVPPVIGRIIPSVIGLVAMS